MFIGAIAVVIILIIIFLTKTNKTNSESIEETEEILPYTKNRFLLSKAENNFYQVLKLSLKDTEYTICPKIRLADVIKTSKTENRQVYFNKISSKHIDFLLCNNDKFFNPILAIELDDKSHESEKVKERDKFINKVFKSAKLPILHIKANYSYKPNELKGLIENKLNITKVVDNKKLEIDNSMIKKLIYLTIKNKNSIPYINLDNNNKYLGWTNNFKIKLPSEQYMSLNLKKEEDLFLLFVLASAWSRTGQWENAAFFTTYLRYYNKTNFVSWLNDSFFNQEIRNRKENADNITKICSGVNPRKRVSFRQDYFSSIRIIIKNWEEIKESLNKSEKENNYNIFINYISSIDGLGAGDKKMRIKIPLILRELRCQNVYNNIPGEFCCVPDARVKEAAEELGIKLPVINSTSSLLKASSVIYSYFGDSYDIPLFAYEDVMDKVSC